jgi:DUF4097 and DUF4098 domain-containing protein YvlB
MKSSSTPIAFSATVVLALTMFTQGTAYAAEGSFQRDLKVTGPVSLDVATGSGNIRVHNGSSDTVKITGHIKTGLFAGNAEEKVRRLEQNPPIEQTGNSIRVGHISDPELRRNISISYEIEVPVETQVDSNTGSGEQLIEGLRGPVNASTGSGSVQVNHVAGSVHANSGSGEIEIKDVKASVRAQTGSGSIRAESIAGGMDLETGSGHISGTQTATGTVRAQTGSGGMDLHGLQGSVDAGSGSGDIEAEGNPQARWNVHTGSGSVHLQLAKDAAFELNAHTGSGHINTNHPITVTGNLGRSQVQGKVRGGGPLVEVHTSSGNIEID